VESFHKGSVKEVTLAGEKTQSAVSVDSIFISINCNIFPNRRISQRAGVPHVSSKLELIGLTSGQRSASLCQQFT